MPASSSKIKDLTMQTETHESAPDNGVVNPEPVNIDDSDLFALRPEDITVEDRDYGSIYPTINWINGMSPLKAAGGLKGFGGFFLDAQQFDEATATALGASPYDLPQTEGDPVPGYQLHQLSGAMLMMRRAYASTKDGFTVTFAASEYDEAVEYGGRARSKCNVLFLPDGIDEPVVLTFAGYSAIHMQAGGRNPGIYQRVGQKLVMAARRELGNQKLPICAFRVTLRPDGAYDESKKGRNKDDEKIWVPKYTTVGQGENKSQITVPVWADEPETRLARADLSARFIGHERFGLAQSMVLDAQPWFDAWSTEKLQAARIRAGRGGIAAPPTGAGPGTVEKEEVPF